LLAGRHLVSTLGVVKTAQEDATEIPARLRRAVGRLNRRLRVTRAGADLTPSKYEVLATVVRLGPLRQSEVAAIEGLNPTMLSRLLGKLEEAGLVTRLADSADGRVVHVASTKMGRDLVTRIRNERSDALSLALKGLTQNEQRTLLAALPVLEALADGLADRPQ
jgi:DNA-binding MarR family transcriptional regulator